MKKDIIGLRSVDVQKSLQTTSQGRHLTELDLTIKIGKFLRLATNIRGHEVISNKKQLDAIGGIIGISPSELKDTIIPLGEKLGLFRCIYDGNRFVKLEENVQPINDTLKTGGEYWKENEPTKVDFTFLDLLNKAMDFPVDVSSYSDEKNKDSVDFSIAVGSQVNLLNKFSHSDKILVSSPLCWEEKRSREVFKICEKIGISNVAIRNLVNQMKSMQGIPMDKVANFNSIKPFIKHGLILEDSLDSISGKKSFLHIPTYRTDRKIGDCVRSLITGVRYGEFYGKVTKIKYPIALLEALKSRGSIKPHSEAKSTFSPWVQQGIIKIVKVGYKWRPIFINTEENIKAVETAIDLLEKGEPEGSIIIEKEIQEILSTGNYINSDVNRSIIGKDVNLPKSYKEKINDILLGVDYDI